MKLYSLLPECDVEGDSPWDWVQLERDWMGERDDNWNTPKRRGPEWKPLKAWIRPVQRQGDFYFFGPMPIVTARAWHAMEPILGDSVEGLAVDVQSGVQLFENDSLATPQLPKESGGRLVLMNVLDRVELRPGSVTRGRGIPPMSTLIGRFIFDETELCGKTIFRVMGNGIFYDHCIVSDVFKKAADEARLIGPEFVEIEWHSEEVREIDTDLIASGWSIVT